MTKRLFAGAALFAVGITMTGGVALAVTSTTGINLVNPLSCSDLVCVAQNIVNFLWLLAIPLCTIMMLIGGFQMMTAAGNPEQFSNGSKTLQYAAIGFVVVLLAGGLVTFIKSLFGQ